MVIFVNVLLGVFNRFPSAAGRFQSSFSLLSPALYYIEEFFGRY